MDRIPKSRGPEFWENEPGPVWRGCQMDGRRAVHLKCPSGHIGGLYNHAILKDGEVRPSVVCPEPGCTWHVWAKLEDWAAASPAEPKGQEAE